MIHMKSQALILRKIKKFNLSSAVVVIIASWV